jgi:hypothetical protein
MPTKYILRRIHSTRTVYFRDINAKREPITTTCAAHALALSMLGAVEIARDLDREAGKFTWKAIPQNPKEPCTCPSI